MSMAVEHKGIVALSARYVVGIGDLYFDGGCRYSY